MTKKPKLDCCGEGEERCCGAKCKCHDEGKNEKNIKVYFCPRCRSKDVKYIFTFGNIFGILPKMKCQKCGYTGIFPQLVIPQKKLDKLNKKYKRRNN
jgi:hypothetical protein